MFASLFLFYFCCVSVQNTQFPQRMFVRPVNSIYTTFVVVYRHRETQKYYRKMGCDMKQIRIKKWFIEKNSKYAENEKWGGKNEYSWWNVTKETEKAYHVNEMHTYCWKGGWVPKSCVLEVREA